MYAREAAITVGHCRDHRRKRPERCIVPVAIVATRVEPQGRRVNDADVDPAMLEIDGRLGIADRSRNREEAPRGFWRGPRRWR